MLILLMVIDFSFKELISSLGPFYEVLCRRHMDATHHHLWKPPPPGAPGCKHPPEGRRRVAGGSAVGGQGSLRTGRPPVLSSTGCEHPGLGASSLVPGAPAFSRLTLPRGQSRIFMGTAGPCEMSFAVPDPAELSPTRGAPPGSPRPLQPQTPFLLESSGWGEVLPQALMAVGLPPLRPCPALVDQPGFHSALSAAGALSRAAACTGLSSEYMTTDVSEPLLHAQAQDPRMSGSEDNVTSDRQARGGEKESQERNFLKSLISATGTLRAHHMVLSKAWAGAGQRPRPLMGSSHLLAKRCLLLSHQAGLLQGRRCSL